MNTSKLLENIYAKIREGNGEVRKENSLRNYTCRP